jgi:hypothetical protein
MESFFTKYEHTIEAFSAFSTFLAVFIAIYIAKRSEKVRLTANVSTWMLVDPSNRGVNPQSIQVSVTNVGTRHTYLPWLFFSWRFPFDTTNATLNPQTELTFPLELAPGRNILLRLSDLDMFKSEMVRMSGHLKWLRRLRLHYCGAVIYTEDGKKFRVKIAPSLRKEFKKLEIS